MFSTVCRISASPKVTGVNELLRKLYEKLKAAGDKNLYYIPTTRLLGVDGEDTVDGTYPTDPGFLRMAQNIAPVVKQALRTTSTSDPSK
jgi:hypothetical protein